MRVVVDNSTDKIRTQKKEREKIQAYMMRDKPRETWNMALPPDRWGGT